MHSTCARVLITATAALAAAPAAGAATLHGTTKDGTKITLKRSGGHVSKIRTMVPSVCVETTGSGATRAGAEIARPPGSFRLGGGRQKASKLQPAAMNGATKATKHYTVSLKRHGRGVKGKVSVNLSFLIPDLFRQLPYMYSCVGTTTFTVR